MSIRIDTKTMDALQRHAEQTAYADMLERTGQTDALAAVYGAEWLERRNRLIEAFLPVVVQLVRAGLVSVQVEADTEQDTYPTVTGRATIAVKYDGSIRVMVQK